MPKKDKFKTTKDLGSTHFFGLRQLLGDFGDPVFKVTPIIHQPANILIPDLLLLLLLWGLVHKNNIRAFWDRQGWGRGCNFRWHRSLTFWGRGVTENTTRGVWEWTRAGLHLIHRALGLLELAGWDFPLNSLMLLHFPPILRSFHSLTTAISWFNVWNCHFVGVFRKGSSVDIGLEKRKRKVSLRRAGRKCHVGYKHALSTPLSY